MEFQEIAIRVVQTTAVLTFLLFLSLVFFSRMKKNNQSIGKNFWNKKSIILRTTLFSIFYIGLFWMVFVNNSYTQNSFMFWSGTTLSLFGLCFAFWGRITLRKVWTPITNPVAPNQMIETGPFRFARHPIYAGRLSFFIGAAFMFNVYFLVPSVLYWLVLGIFAYKEESQLQTLSIGYEKYLQNMSSIPRLFIRL